jgi:molybdopterin/thiamine biosynthesis adenylyltransferase
MDDLFVRVRPLVGEALTHCQVAVIGSPRLSPLVEHLVACGVRRWLVMEGNPWMPPVVKSLRKRYGNAIDINVECVKSITEMSHADLALVDDMEMAQALPDTLSRLVILLLDQGQSCHAVFALPNESLDLPNISNHALQCGWDWLTAAPLMALAARALLLRGTAFAMLAWEDAWAKGQRVYTVGSAYDPTLTHWQTQLSVPTIEHTGYRTPHDMTHHREGTLLITGVGSLGSVAAHALAPYVTRMVLVDPDRVEVANLVRQAYRAAQIGQPKVVALTESLQSAYPHLTCEPVVAAVQADERAAALIRQHGVSAALVTTGTQADFAISRALRAAALPHVVGRCYARARFWEAIVVDGANGPSYEQVRRAVSAGPTPAPTPEEIAAYGAVGELAGEPATSMETGWAAMWLARLLAQLMAPPALREGWLLARLAAEAPCFIGGVEVEQGVEGAAYGVQTPGELHAWSLAQVA